MANIELPTSNEMFLLDQMRDVMRASEGTTYETRVRDLLFEMLTDALYSEAWALRVMKRLDGAMWLSASNAIRQELGEA